MVSYDLKAEHLYIYPFLLIHLFHVYKFLPPLSMLSFFHYSLGFWLTIVQMSIFYAAVDDTQRMMQMGGFGFDPSKVQI